MSLRRLGARQELPGPVEKGGRAALVDKGVLAGKATYDGESLTAKLLAHQNHPIPALRSVRADVVGEPLAASNPARAQANFGPGLKISPR